MVATDASGNGDRAANDKLKGGVRQYPDLSMVCVLIFKGLLLALDLHWSYVSGLRNPFDFVLSFICF